MNKKVLLMKKLLLCILCFLIQLNSVSAFSFSQRVMFFEDFNSYATNETKIDTLDITGGTVRVVDDGNTNKSLLLSDKGSITIKKISDALEDKFVLSADFRNEGNSTSFKIGICGTSNIYLVSVENGVIKSHDGKVLGGVSSNFCNIAIKVNSKRKTYSVSVNGRAKISDWSFASITSVNGICIFKPSVTDSQLHIDNIALYNNEDIIKNFNHSKYNTEYKEYLGVVDDTGDYMYFSSNYININTMTYNYTSYDVKAEYNSVEYAMATKDKVRDKYIKLHKGGDLGCLMDVRLNKRYTMSSEKVENYYLVSVRAKVDNLTAPVQFFMMRDTTSTSSQQDVTIGTILANGDLQLCDGTVIKNVAINGKWFGCKYAIDMINHSIDVYINDTLIKENIPFTKTFNKIYMFRCRIMDTGGMGDLYLEDYEITGLEVPYKNGVEIMTSIFADDTPIAKYLEDKVGVQAYREVLYANGKKTFWNNKMFYENGDVFVPVEALKIAFEDLENIQFEDNEIIKNGEKLEFSKAPKIKAGELLYPIGEFAEKALGKHFIDDKKGMILIADRKLMFDVDSPEEKYKIYIEYTPKTHVRTELEELNAFLFYDRPKAEEIKELFSKVTQNGNMHPRVMASAEDFKRVRENYYKDETMKKMYDYFMQSADKFLGDDVPLIDYKWDTIQKYTQINNSRDFRFRMECLGFAYQMTGDRKYSNRAWKEFQSLSTFPDFDYGHPIDTGEYQMGAAIGYDWMYDAFTDEQRKIIQDTIYRNGTSVVWQSYYGRTRPESGAVQNWSAYKFVSNFNTVMNGGNIAAAIALADVYPDVCFDVLEKAFRSLEFTFIGLAPHGGWDEGSNYWAYTMDYMIRAFMTSKVALGTDFNMMKSEGVSDTGRYIVAIQSLNGGNAFHDSPSSSSTTHYSFPYLSKVFNQPELQALRTQAWQMELNGGTNIMEIFTYDPNVDTSAINNLPNLLVTHGTESFSIRESYQDSNGLYLSGHFGAVNCNHAHNDTGAFVLEMLGEKWAEDLGMESYSLTVKSNELYRKRTEGHNTFTINNTTDFNQSLDGFAPIIKYESKERGAYVVSDMSSVYSDVSNMLMGYYVGDDMESITMRAEMELKKKSEIYWFMHTQADILLDNENNKAILTKKGKSVVLDFITDASDFELSVMNARPLPGSPDPEGQNLNAGYRKVAIKMNATGNVNLTVKISPLGSKAESTGIYDVPISEWTIPDGPIEKNEVNYDLSCKYFIINGEEYPIISSFSVPYGEGMPKISAVPTNPNNIVEVTEAKTVDDVAIIRVYNPEKSRYAMYVIKFTTNYSSFGSFDGRKPYVIKNIDVTAEPQPANIKGNMIDNDMSTRWTVLSMGENAVFDMGIINEVSSVAIAFWKGNTRKYKFNLFVSEDGENYTKVLNNAESSGTTENYEIFSFDTVKARYVKLEGWGNTDILNSVNTNILEFRILQ